MADTTYIIRGGVEGKKRLAMLANVLRPTTTRLFEAAGLAEGMDCLDLGCGGGDVALQLAQSVGPRGRVTGVDMDQTKLDLARQAATDLGLANIQFTPLNVQEWAEQGVYDCIYSRFLLTHLADPRRVLGQMHAAARPGGVLMIEDIDFTGHFCHPPCPAFEAYIRLYRAAAARRSADADIGPKLHGMLLGAGWQDVQINVIQPTFVTGEGKQCAVLTLVNIADALLAENLISEAELQQTVDELAAFTNDPRTTISLPRIFQVWGRKSTRLY